MILTETDSDQTLGNTHLWSAPMACFQPQLTQPRSQLRMAAIVSDRLYHGLKFEGEMLLLTPENWELTLNYGNPDVLLIESCWDTATGHWFLSQTHPGEEHEILLSIIAYCKKCNIPTVYWYTQDFLYHDVFCTFAVNFDFVFCADPRNIDYLKKNSVDANLLLPAVQPAIHNPFRDFNIADEFSLGVLYDGWADILRLGGNLDFLKQLKPLGLAIIESRYRLFRNKLNGTQEFDKNILGCVHWKDRLMALKYAQLCVMADTTISTSTSQQWMALENVACKVPVLYRGKLEPDDIRQNVVNAISTDAELIKSATYLLSNDLPRAKQAHLGWRYIYQNHTYSHRLASICNQINIKHEIIEHPLVSIVIATFRESLLSRCIENYNKQTYTNKELILVMNSNSFSQEQVGDIVKNSPNIRVFTIPSERVEGGCLNFGNMAAKGEFIIKMDDDDVYSTNYVTDMILNGKAVDADVFGKSNPYIHFQDDDKTYHRKRKELSVIPSDELLRAHIGGNSLSGKAAFLQSKRYSNTNFASTDTCYHGNTKGCNGIFALYDNFGVIVERTADVSGHSWKLDSESLKKTMVFVCDGIADDILI